jgi:hypothetical protein
MEMHGFDQHNVEFLDEEEVMDLEADVVMVYNEHRLNMMHKGNKNGFSQMFKGGEADI